MTIIFGKLISIIFIIAILGVPIIDPLNLTILFVGTILILFSDFKKVTLKKNKLLIFLVSIFIVSNQFLPKVQIEEASNLILFKKEENLALKKALPDEIYHKFKNYFKFHF